MSNEHNSAPTVLVVDDFDDARTMMALILKSEGYEIAEASDGREAIETARRVSPDLVLMDLSLPVLDGLSATCRLRELEEMRDMPIVALSAHHASTHARAALAVGCDAYLEKPIDMDALRDVVARLLAGAADGARVTTPTGGMRFDSRQLGDDELQASIDRLLTESAHARDGD